MAELSGRLAFEGEEIAWRRTPGRGPTVVWLGGFRSDMAGTKADALAGWAAARSRDVLRFDYTGHGQSSGAFEDGTIGRWRADALAVIDRLTEGELILVGSSMGGWIASLVALARPERIGGLVLVAPAPDFTDKLMEPGFTAAQRQALEEEGAFRQGPDDHPEGYWITRALIEDGRDWSVLPGPVEIAAPVRILQGGRDEAVPWRHALDFAEALVGQDVVFTLIRDGDHRLSRPEDLDRILAAVEELAG